MNNDTPDIDKKKESSFNEQNQSLTKFLKNLFFLSLFLFIYFTISGFTLYQCKVAQSGLLPTNSHCFPYENREINIQTILSNLFYYENKSEKISFSNSKTNLKNTILDVIRIHKNNPFLNTFSKFIYEQLSSVFHFQYSSLEFYFQSLNQLPETIILLIGPILSLFLFLLLPFIGLFDFIYRYFIHFKWLFQVNTNKHENHLPDWKSNSFVNPFEWMWSCFYCFLFFLFFFIGFFLFPLLEFFAFLYSFFSIFFYESNFHNKKSNAFDIVKNMFHYYKVTISSLFSFLLILNTFSSLGTVSGVLSILVVLSLYFNIIPLNIFKPNIPSFLSELVKNTPSIKKCKTKINDNPSWSDIFNS